MKKVSFIGTILLCGMLIFSNNVEAQSRKEKKAAKEAKKAEWEKKRAELIESRLQLEAEMGLLMDQSEQTPCADQSKSDEEYFRMLGVGKDSEKISIAKKRALQDIKIKMIKQIGEIVRGLVAQYSESNSKIEENADTKDILEQALLGETFSFISNFDPICENMSFDARGYRIYYYAVEIPKKGLVDAMVSAINGDENLKAVCDTEIFRQFAEEYLKNARTH